MGMGDLKVKMLPIVEKFIKTQLATLEGKYAALKEKSDKMLIEFRVKALELYKKVITYVIEEYKLVATNAIEKYNWVLESANKVYEKNTIAQNVAFAEEGYKQVMLNVNELKMKYLKDLTAVYENCKSMISKI